MEVMVTTTAAATTVNMLACHHPNAVTTIQQPSTTKFSHPLVELAEKQHDEDLLFFLFSAEGLSKKGSAHVNVQCGQKIEEFQFINIKEKQQQHKQTTTNKSRLQATR